jgi:hypothetical protein
MQRAGGVAEQGVAEGGEAGRQEVEHVVDARRRPAEAQVARVAIAPHGVEGVGEAEQQRPGPPSSANQNSAPKIASLPFSSTDSTVALATPDSSSWEVSRETIHDSLLRASARSPAASGTAIARACSARLRPPTAR